MKTKKILKISKKSKPNLETPKVSLSKSSKESENLNSTQATSLSSAANITESPSHEVNSISKIIEESKENLAQKIQEQAPKKRGRPRKDAQAASTTQESASAPSAQVATSPAMEIPVEVLGPVVSMPFAIAASSTKFDGFSLSKEESDILAKQADAVIRQYMPAMNSPHAAAIIFGLTFATFGVVRYKMYLDWKKENGARNAEMLREVRA